MGVNGRWRLVIQMEEPPDVSEASVELHEDEARLTGVWITEDGAERIDAASLDGDSISWQVNHMSRTGPVVLTFEGLVEDEQEMSGTVTAGTWGAAGTFRGRRLAA